MKNSLLSTLCLTLLVALLALHATPAQARVWRIDNNANAQADFAQGTTALADARVVNGDTLYFNGSATVYANFNVTKRLVIFGVGYLLDQNPNTQVSFNAAQVNAIYFLNGSSGSEIQGMDMNQVYVYVSNISVRRNACAVYIYTGQTNGATSISGVFISQNWLSYVTTNASISSVSNVFITNNYIYSNGVNTGPIPGVTVAQNVINGPGITTNAGYVYNNIMLSGSVSGTANAYNNNISNAAQFPAGNGNQQNVSMASVFLSTTTGSTDGRYQLRTNSPALAAGINGEDIGMFGGTDPYVLSGIPPIPSIWFFSQPSVVPASGVLQVRLKASSHN